MTFRLEDLAARLAARNNNRYLEFLRVPAAALILLSISAA